MEEKEIFDKVLNESKENKEGLKDQKKEDLKESISYEEHNQLVDVLNHFAELEDDEAADENEIVTVITDAFSNSDLRVEIIERVGRILAGTPGEDDFEGDEGDIG